LPTPGKAIASAVFSFEGDEMMVGLNPALFSPYSRLRRLPMPQLIIADLGI